MKAPCYQHDSYDRDCSSCVEMNQVGKDVSRKPAPDLLSLADELADVAQEIEDEYISNKGTDSAFATCMTEVTSYTRNKSGRAMWKKWERYMTALSAYQQARKGKHDVNS